MGYGMAGIAGERLAEEVREVVVGAGSEGESRWHWRDIMQGTRD